MGKNATFEAVFVATVTNMVAMMALSCTMTSLIFLAGAGGREITLPFGAVLHSILFVSSGTCLANQLVLAHAQN